MNKVILSKGSGDKKFKVKVDDKTVQFGLKGYSDFIKSGGNQTKKKAYIARHRVNEDWSKSGMKSAGFWAKHLLWNKKSLNESIKDTERRFNINIVRR